MLMLTVPKEEYLMIGRDIKITFLGGNNNQLRVMIDAPKDVNIARGRAIKRRAAKGAAKRAAEASQETLEKTAEASQETTEKTAQEM